MRVNGLVRKDLILTIVYFLMMMPAYFIAQALVFTSLPGRAIIVMTTIIIVFMIIMIYKKEIHSFDFNRLKAREWRVWFQKGFNNVVIINVVYFILTRFIWSFPGRQLTAGDLSLKIPIVVLSVIFVGPILEEIIFRRFLFGFLGKKIGQIPAAVLSSLLFCTIHLSWPFLPVYLITGLVLCWVYHKSGELLPCTLIHMAINTGDITRISLHLFQ